jgi:hypothetical protein
MSRSSKEKREDAQAHNYALEVGQNIMPVGRCSCGGVMVVYLASKLENSCTYYCLQCPHTGSLKNIDKKDAFLFPLKDIISEVRQHYPTEDFDKFYSEEVTDE